jgi:serum/glucocorticoid-regulated kinase 2
MVLNYMAGGELFFWLKKDRRFSEERCRLYTAEITSALEALHANNIIYRDLKPENLLLDAEGHIRLTDFGLAKGGITSAGPEGGTKTFCGTPEYLAPEILENKGHGKAVDWWSLGTFLYEMLWGLPPFYDTNVQRMYQKILQSQLKFPKNSSSGSASPSSSLSSSSPPPPPLLPSLTSVRRQISNEARTTITGLLQRKIDERLGSGPTDALELKQSDFLAVLDFERVVRRGYTPEFIPPAQRDDTDVRNFDREFTEEGVRPSSPLRPPVSRAISPSLSLQAVDSVVTTHMTGSMTEKTRFEGFTYEGDKNHMKS